MNKRVFPFFGAALVMGGAVFDYAAGFSFAAVAAMLFWPLLDPHRHPLSVIGARKNLLGWSALLFPSILLVALYPSRSAFALNALLFAALPEEWFFRAYLMPRLGIAWRANFIASLLFAATHAIVQGWLRGLLVFIPSLFYGWLYQKTKDLVLVILLHAFSNIFYVLFVHDRLYSVLGIFIG